MNTYYNLNGNSNVTGYEIGIGSITVQFRTGAIYEYTFASAGEYNIRQMQSLAQKGSGLNGYINRYAKKLYARRIA